MEGTISAISFCPHPYSLSPPPTSKYFQTETDAAMKNLFNDLNKLDEFSISFYKLVAKVWRLNSFLRKKDEQKLKVRKRNSEMNKINRKKMNILKCFFFVFFFYQSKFVHLVFVIVAFSFSPFLSLFHSILFFLSFSQHFFTLLEMLFFFGFFCFSFFFNMSGLAEFFLLV